MYFRGLPFPIGTKTTINVRWIIACAFFASANPEFLERWQIYLLSSKAFNEMQPRRIPRCWLLPRLLADIFQLISRSDLYGRVFCRASYCCTGNHTELKPAYQGVSRNTSRLLSFATSSCVTRAQLRGIPDRQINVCRTRIRVRLQVFL